MISVTQVDGYIHNEEETRFKKIIWEEMNKDYIEEQAAKEEALKLANEALKANSSSCPEHARKLFEASKAEVAKFRKEKQQKRAEEAKNAPPPATAMEAVRRTLDKKRLSGVINYDVLEELFDTSTAEKSAKRSKTERDMEKKKEVKSNKHENDEDEAEKNEDGYVESYDINTDFPNGEKFYEDEEDEDGYDFGLY